jgi:fructose-1,6-bisphosphatase-3
MTTQNITPEGLKDDLRYLQLLSCSFPTIADASTEIINLEAILNLPKGTEHFLTDIHGEYEAFQHVLKNASGAVKRKVNEIFGNTLREAEKKELCTLIYYPEEKLQLVKSVEKDIDDWYIITLNQLVKVCQNVSSKYTRSKVRKSLPPEFSYIIQELLHESSIDPNKHAYINVIVSTIISTGRADDFIIAMCNLIQRLTIDSLHIVGDIFDRGPGAHIIMDTLCDYHNFDIQWGNHDILWMGAAAGNDSCMASVIRLSMRYGNLATLEDGYGINLLPLATFAMDTYADDPCLLFQPKICQEDSTFDEKTVRLIAQMHKAITIIQFKLEAQIIDRRPELGMADRKLLEYIDREKGVLRMGGKEYALRDTNFPTIDPADPYRLTDEEADLVNKLHHSFLKSEKLRKHMRCLFTNGGMYTVCNSNLIYHASIPMNEDGTFREVMIGGKPYSGRRLMDRIDVLMRTAYFGEEGSKEKLYAMDYVWYLWCGPDSPLFDKSKMATFERYFLSDKETYKEQKGYYYTLRDSSEWCEKILAEFGVTGPHTHIINGHVPVKTIKGEKPIKADGKLLVIDGGFSKAYQPETGIAGYTLVYHSHGMQLVQHEPFQSRQKAIEEGLDIKSTTFVVEFNSQRMMVKDTDKGRELARQIEELNKLLVAYRKGIIKEKG